MSELRLDSAKRSAQIRSPGNNQVSHDRYDGYRDALQEAGIALDPALILEGDFEPSGGYSCAHALFARPLAERPTAIFAGSDLIAYGVISAAQECGLRIPSDIALIGFDDNPSSAHMQPALTTIQQPFAEMGRRAVELLLHLIDQSCFPHWSQQDQPGLFCEIPRIQLPTSLKIRESCGMPLPIHDRGHDERPVGP
ncbi:hypothetical protein KDH_10890 [Dictyobacter sp. S3.2.2.5]|uniref:Transcriptional regulator LacI/GalR-like sensor domain-containing protein n=1 Tax=Dictyobacter halimunensis TaxID=3026934 RepID=A0ABQ6FKR9_9CHLR|nr:hypothetical protein KDH_10890 [Dictyobacter sp. S3.2.2.5]